LTGTPGPELEGGSRSITLRKAVYREYTDETFPREYHGTATLLPDGRVLESGMGADFGNVPNQLSAEFFSPVQGRETDHHF
jgi:hypothetical protein